MADDDESASLAVVTAPMPILTVPVANARSVDVSAVGLADDPEALPTSVLAFCAANAVSGTDPEVIDSEPPSTVPVTSTLGVPSRLSVLASSVVDEVTVVPGVTVTKSGMVG